MPEDTDVSFNAKVMCDLTPLGLGRMECDANIVFGPFDDPDSIEITVPLPRAQIVDLYRRSLDLETYLGTPEIEGRVVGSETTFKGALQLTGMQPIGMFESLRITCAFRQFEFRLGTDEINHPTVVFRITNVPHRVRGDLGVVRPVRDHSPTPLQTDHFQTTELRSLSDDERRERFRPGWQFSTSRINFRFGGTQWSLDMTQGSTDRDGKALQLQPIVTATLTTESPASDESLGTIADHICDLLTLAFGKDVRWISCGRFSSERQGRVKCRDLLQMPYHKGSHPLVDNWEIGNVKQFLEESESEFNRHPEWWHRSIGLLAHSRGMSLLEIRLSTLNTLVDRVSNCVVGNQRTDQIDPDLPGRLDGKWFCWRLHRLLQTLSRHWDQNRTNRICDTIRQWNATPSFPNQVARACETLGISVPAREQLGLRHKLIHAGEFDRSLDTPEKMIAYLQALEAVVELMLIRMLNFTGFIHIDERGQRWQKVDAFVNASGAS